MIFGKPPGASNGIAWSAYSGLIAFIAGFVHDAVIGGLAFASALQKTGMTVFWVLELLVGSGLFASLYVIKNKFDALLGMCPLSKDPKKLLITLPTQKYLQG